MMKRTRTSSNDLGDDFVCRTLADLEAMPLPKLRAFWTRRWSAPPAYRTRDLLLRAAAWKLQAEVHGGLAPKLRRSLLDLGDRFSADRKFHPSPTSALPPGTTLVREWGGRRHEVAVVEGGFEYDGSRFSSLSAAAKHITGTPWNGPVF